MEVRHVQVLVGGRREKTDSRWPMLEDLKLTWLSTRRPLNVTCLQHFNGGLEFGN